MKKTMAIILTLSAILLSINLTGVSAKTEKVLLFGDVNRDYSIDIADVLLSEKYLANIEMLDSYAVSALDVNGDNISDIMDCLIIKRHLAGISTMQNGKLYFVSKDGNDDNDGSIDRPFLTVQKAANVMVAGDTCLIKEGVYRETVTPKNSGTQGREIIFMPFENDKVVVSGTEKVNTNWTLYKDGIYKTNFTLWRGDENQLFVNNKMAQIARYPNKNSDNEISVGTVLSADNANSSNVSDSQLTEDDGFFNNAKIYIEGTSHYLYYKGVVEKYTKGYAELSGISDGWDNPQANSNYYFYDSLNLLDEENEWYYDKSTSTLYYKPEQSVNINDLNIEASFRSQGFNVKGKSYITIKDIEIFGATVATDENSKNLMLDGDKVLYYYHTMAGRNYPWEANWFGVELWGENSVVKNCEIAYGAEGGVEVYANNCSVVNNYIHDINYTNTNAAAVETKYCENTLISHNTIDNIARTAIILGTKKMRVSYNKISNCAINTYDVSGIGSYKTDAENTIEVDHNVIYNCNNSHDFVAYYLDNGSLNFLVHHNVCYDVDLAMILNNPSYNNRIYNNTFLSEKPISTGNLQNPFENNAFIGAVWDGDQFYNNIMPSVFYGKGAYFKNNLLFNDPDVKLNYDGTLKSDSIAIGQGIKTPVSDENCDIGAYNYNEEKWLSGCDFNKEYPIGYSLTKLNDCSLLKGKMFIESDLSGTLLNNNTSFENSTADWGGFNWQTVNENATLGEYSAKIQEGWLEKTVDVKKGQMYRFSGDIKMGKFGNFCEFGVHFMDNNYNIIKQGSFMVTATEYENFETVFAVPENCTKMRIFAASWGKDYYAFADNVRCELLNN